MLLYEHAQLVFGPRAPPVGLERAEPAADLEDGAHRAMTRPPVRALARLRAIGDPLAAAAMREHGALLLLLRMAIGAVSMCCLRFVHLVLCPFCASQK